MAVLLAVMLVVCGMFWIRFRNELAQRRQTQREWAKEAMVNEAETVVMDFLDYGKEVAQATDGKYRGTISFRLQSCNQNGEMGFFVTMHDSGDLPRLGGMTLSRFHLEGFAKKYGFYYDPDRNSIRYQTDRSVSLAPGEKAELERRLIQRIQNHPMALIRSENVIGTRGI